MAGTVDFDAFVADAEAALLRIACLLTGDRRAAEDLLSDALADAHRRWRRRGVRRPPTGRSPGADGRHRR